MHGGKGSTLGKSCASRVWIKKLFKERGVFRAVGTQCVIAWLCAMLERKCSVVYVAEKSWSFD